MYLPKKSLQPRKIFIASAIAFACLSLLTPWKAQAQSDLDPPSRVARLSYVRGTPSFAPANSDEWTEANVNRPFTTGDSLWVPESARTELHIGSSAIRLGEQTSLSFDELSDHVLRLKLTRGSLIIRVRDLPNQDTIEINTPNLAFAIQEVGEYRLNVNPDDSTELIVRRGAGVAYGEDDSLTLRDAEHILFSGRNLTHSAINQGQAYDELDLWASERDKQENNAVAAQFVSREVIGYEQLDQYGAWETHAEYGAVWYPRKVAHDWSPYRDGNWVWIAPWGWTWVDRAPWGFAPYHYGRWAYIGSRWAWVPGEQLRHPRPIYAPALVSFVGQRGGTSVSINISNGHTRSPAVAWFPLAPGERYRPTYRSSERYLQNLQQYERWQVRDTNVEQYKYRNQTISNAVTAVPVNTFVAGSAVKPANISMSHQQIVANQNNVAQTDLTPAKEGLFGGMRHVSRPKDETLYRPVINSATVINAREHEQNRRYRREQFNQEASPQQTGNTRNTTVVPNTPNGFAGSPVPSLHNNPNRSITINTPNVPVIPVAPPASSNRATGQDGQGRFNREQPNNESFNQQDLRDRGNNWRRPTVPATPSTPAAPTAPTAPTAPSAPLAPTSPPTLTAPVAPTAPAAVTPNAETPTRYRNGGRTFNQTEETNEPTRRGIPIRPAEREAERFTPRQPDAAKPNYTERVPTPDARRFTPPPQQQAPTATAQPAQPVQQAQPAAGQTGNEKPERERRGRGGSRDNRDARVNEK